MSLPDSGLDIAARPRRRSRWVVVGWIVAGIVVLGVLGFLWLVLSLRSAFPPLPSLYRPQGVVGGSLRLDPSAGPQLVPVRLRVSAAAVAAARAGDGLVHLELDLAGEDDAPIASDVGVRWQDPGADVRTLGPLEAGADVRWTLDCPSGQQCERVVELTFAPASGESRAVAAEWRLVAGVRPPRGTDVPADATVSLVLATSTP
jgi:hypothetical protein